MVEVGIRDLKGRLSYYVQLVQAGELVVIKVRNRVVGFLSNIRPSSTQEAKMKNWKPKKLQKKIEKWKNEGLLLNGGMCRPHPIQPIEFTKGETTSDLLRKIRDEEV